MSTDDIYFCSTRLPWTKLRLKAKDVIYARSCLNKYIFPKLMSGWVCTRFEMSSLSAAMWHCCKYMEMPLAISSIGGVLLWAKRKLNKSHQWEVCMYVCMYVCLLIVGNTIKSLGTRIQTADLNCLYQF